MTVVPVSPHLNTIYISDRIKLLFLKDMSVIPSYQVGSSSSQLSNSANHSQPRRLEVSNLQWLKDMPVEYFQSLAGMRIIDKEVESLSQVEELFQTWFLSGLRFLSIDRCPKLTSVSGWLERLSTLQSLSNCPNLLDGIPWQHLPPNLHCLFLVNFENMEKLPEGMQYCTSLQSLVIAGCPKLESLPNWMTELTSLRRLQFRYCSKNLKERCQEPDGEDWPLIQHIAFTLVRQVEDETSIEINAADYTLVMEDLWR